MKSNTRKNTKFQVIVLGNYLHRSNVEAAIRAFYKFFHLLTPKRQQRVRCIIFDFPEELLPLLSEKNILLPDGHPVFVLENRKLLQMSDAFFEENNLIFHPEHRCDETSRITLLCAGLPILTFGSWERVYGFEDAAAVFLPKEQEDQPQKYFSQLLKVLYHDPYAFEMLKKKAEQTRRVRLISQPNS